MIKFEPVSNNDFFKEKLASVLVDIGIAISKEREFKILSIEVQKVTFNKDSWIDINFKIKNNDPDFIARMNIILAKRLAQNPCFINSNVEYIPTFVAGEDHGSICQGVY